MKTYKIGNKAYAVKAEGISPNINTITNQIGWQNYEVVGSPSVASDNVVDGFSTSNYVKTQELDLGSNWEFRTRFKVNTLSSVQRVFDGVTNPYLLAQINTTGAIQYAVGDGTSYYNLLDGKNKILSSGYWFEVKITFDGSIYKAYISSDNGKTWLEDWSYESDMIIPPFVGVFGISRDLTNCVNAGRIALGSQNTWFKITKKTSLKVSEKLIIVGNPTITEDGILSNIDDSNYVELSNNETYFFHHAAQWQLTFRTPSSFRQGNTYVFGAPWYTSIWIGIIDGVYKLIAQDWGQTTNNITILINEIKPNTEYTINFEKSSEQIVYYYYNNQLVGTTIAGNTGSTNMSYCRLGKIGSVNTYMTGSYDLTKCYVRPASQSARIYFAEKNEITGYYVFNDKGE